MTTAFERLFAERPARAAVGRSLATTSKLPPPYLGPRNGEVRP